MMFGFRNIKRHISGHSSTCAILMYHHIRNDIIDPWETCVSGGHFKEQLEVLKKEYEVLPLLNYEQALCQGKYKRKKVFITFDDGYLDNYEAAVPELKRHGFTATFFVPTQILDGPEYFWWEIVDHLFWRGEKSPEQIILTCGKFNFTRSVASSMAADSQVEKSWSANDTPPPTERCRAYLELCNWIKERSPDEQQLIVQQLMALCADERIAEAQKMSAARIKQLSADGFEIGAHTVHHPALGLQLYEVQQSEITSCKASLEELTGKPVVSIAYPHGHFNHDTVKITRDAGYRLACTTEGGGLNKNSDRFTLPRVWVKNIDGVSFQQELARLFKY